MTDLISRQAALDALNGEITITGRANAEIVKGYMLLVKDRIERLPSAQKKGHWIPCSTQLPEDEEKVLCCTKTKKGTANIVLGYYASGRWCCGMNSNVTAWMPLPKPYRED